ncbi:MAG: DUF1569 domain-containing protein [Bryobacterales bacterium]|nr:DUF1569 domain-containing protein [Bryobacterales bacterium]
MKSVRDAAARKEILARMARLEPGTRPKWGKMTAAQMLGHVAAPMRGAMGEMKVTGKPGPLRNRIIRYLVIHVLPWPRGVPTVPEYVHAGEEDFSKNIHALTAVLERFAAALTLAPHPAFGTLSRKDWGCLTYRHLDHHLKQFGL